MHDYLPEETARWLLMELARTTLLVTLLGAALWLVLKLAQVRSPLLHRLGCVVVLLAGWSLMRWPVDVAWYEAPEPMVMPEVAEAEPEPQRFTPPIDPKLLSPPPEFGAAMGAPVPTIPEDSEPTVEVKSHQPIRPTPVDRAEPRPAWRFTREQVAVAVWLSGISFVVLWWIAGYLRFLWQLPRGVEGEPQWHAEFVAAAEGQGRAGGVEFRVTDGAGPLLCRLPGRTVLLVPYSLWTELEPSERRAILKHELEHLRRGDLWKSLVVRVLALPHWFNPAAWLAVRRFDEAAEWACDQAAMASEPTSYAAMLLRLGELAGTRARFGSAMSNRPLTTRIRRLLTLNGTEDSAMKKACLISLLLLVLPLALVRVNLVAEEPEATPEAAQPADGASADGAALPAAAKSDPGLFDEQIVPPSPVAGELAPPVADKAAADDPVKAAQRKMVEMARKTYEAQQAAYQAGTVTLDQVFLWSNLRLSSELAIAESRQEQVAAAQSHLQRMQSLEAVIRRLFERGSRGGEANAMYGASFYVADAERRLAEVEAMPLPLATAPRAAADRALADAARQAFEATLAAYEAGTGTIETVISWSIRWLTAELEIARSREEQLAATQANLARISGLHDKVEALYRTGSKGGEANLMATANYYLADAMQRLEKVKREPERLGVQLSPTPVSKWPTSELPTPTSQPPANAESTGKVKIGSRSFYVDDPELTNVLKSVLQKTAPADETLDAIKAIRRRGVNRDGTVAEVISLGLAPELVQLLGHEDKTIREHAEMMLWKVYGPAEPALRVGAESDNPERAMRSRRLMQATRAVVSGSTIERQQVIVPDQPAARTAPSAQPAIGPILPDSPSTRPTPARAEAKPDASPAFRPTEAGSALRSKRGRSREFREGMPSMAEPDELYYDGKTFDQWRDQLRTDLSPTRRIEAINAIGEFAAHGYGKETADVLFDTMRDYSVWALFEDTPDGHLKNVAVEAALRIPAADRLPAVIEALSTGNKNQKLFALRIVPLDAAKDEIVPPLAMAVGDADRQVVELARAPLAIIDHGNAALIASIRRGLTSTDGKEVHNAVWLARGCPLPLPGQKAVVTEPFPELLPEALELLDHDDPKIQETTAAALTTSVIGPSQMHYVEALERIAGSGEGAAAVHARKILEQINPQTIDRRK